jgi:sugar transferase (PEP-CTERM system associated)
MKLLDHHLSAQTVFLVVWDVVTILGASYAGSSPAVFGLPPLWLGMDPILPKAVALLTVSLGTLYLVDLYQLNAHLGKKECISRVLVAYGGIALLYGALGFLFPSLRLSRTAYLLALLLSLSAAVAGRLLALALGSAAAIQERVLFLGATPLAERVIEAVKRVQGYACEILGYVDDRAPHEIHITNGFRVLGTTKDLQRVVSNVRAGTIVVALSQRRGNFPLSEILACKLAGTRVQDWPDFYERATGKVAVEQLRPSWLVFSDGFHRTRMTRVVKRTCDIALSLGFLLGGAPVYALIAILIKLDSRGPVFLRQERVGERGRTFRVLKFRTMAADAEEQTGPVWASENDPRITRVGRFLRESRLDEFPQVINILKGEMSFVGPRPERPHFVAQLQEKIPFYSQRHTVKPGITGWAQVKYNYGASMEDAREKLQYDLYYIKNMSMFLDLVILLYSVQVVLFSKGSR